MSAKFIALLTSRFLFMPEPISLKLKNWGSIYQNFHLQEIERETGRELRIEKSSLLQY